MIRRPKSRELIAGFADDPTFGPVILFGRGGTAVEAIDDKALALPPLDMKLAGRLISRTRVSRVLKGYRNVPAADERTVRAALVRLAQLAADLPELRELDINPLLADADGVLALDARARIAPVAGPARAGHPRFAIRPYPREWERTVELPDGASVHLRPVRPEDEGLMEELLNSIRPEDLRLRFLAPVKVTHAFLARLVQLDYGRAIAFLALDANEGTPLGVVRLHADADHRTGEYGVLVRSDLKGRGLGGELMRLVLEWAKADGLETVEGYVLRENRTMLGMCRSLGFEMAADPDDARVMHVRLAIPAAP
jgi:acetyltransferase